MSLNQSVAMTTAALYMALRAPQNRVQDLVELAEGFARKLTPAQVERAKQRALEMLVDDAGEGIRRVEDILAMEAK